ncbi:MAG TPA: type II secretion system protein [Candidatus Saccharimonadia bacterium]
MFVKRSNQKGFTLVETVLAMAIFTFVLLILVGALTGLYRIYRATAGIRDTQQQARTVSEEITRATRNASYVIPKIDTASGNNAICLYRPASRVSNILRGPSEVFSLEGTTTKKIVWRKLDAADLALDGSTVCDPNLYANPRDLTSPEVSVMLFYPTAASLVAPATLKTMLNFELRIASTRALASEINTSVAFDPANPENTGPVCDDGLSYCSMTGISSGVQARSQIAGGD